jgi:ATP-dependent RNA helicase DDX27
VSTKSADQTLSIKNIKIRYKLVSFSAKFFRDKDQKMGVKRLRDFILTIEDDDVVSQSESDSDDNSNDNKKRKMDEDMNPDFEFDGFDMLEGVKGIDDDGWGFGGVTGMKKGAGVDLDGIIARRRKNLNDDEEEEEEAEDNENELADGSDDESGGDEEFNGFDDDDEIGTFFHILSNYLAEDGFGMGANDEEEVEGVDEEQISNVEDNDELKGEEDASKDEASDSDSVASYHPHPDDLASDSDSDDVQEDAEETARKAAYFAPAEDDTPTDVQPFMAMGLTRPTLKALAAMNFDQPTQIQARTIPIALQGKDIVGSAVTGSGKTAAFMIPILERLSYRSRSITKTRVLVLTPTRELAMQCFDVATKLARFTDVKFTLIVGGLSVKSQETELRKGPDVVIATPGRFIDHVRNSQGFVPDGIEILVIDEADRYTFPLF